MFRPCSRYASSSRCVSTQLEVSFDRRSMYARDMLRAQDVFQLCLRYLSTVARCMFQPCSSFVFDRARSMFRPCSRFVSTVLDICFDRARGLFRPCLRYLSAVARGMFRTARVMFSAKLEICTRYVSTELKVCLN